MTDAKAKARHRKKINDLVKQRIGESGRDETEVRKEIMKELRALKKERKGGKALEIAKIQKKVKKDHAGESETAVNKAIAAAVAKFHSERKKKKREAIKNSAQNIIQLKIREKWCPSTESWFDTDCSESYNYLYLLGAMLDMNIEKNTEEFENQFPIECSKHFDLMAKKRFNKKEVPAAAEDDNEEKKAKTQKRKKSRIEKALNQKLNENPGSKSDQQILKEIVKELKDKQNATKVKQLRKNWFPVNQAWFDQECKDMAEEINSKATELGLDLKSSPADFRKMKGNAKDLTKNYFKLLEKKKSEHSRTAEKENKTKKKNKKKKKKSADAEEQTEPLEQNRENKKIKFEDSDEES